MRLMLFTSSIPLVTLSVLLNAFSSSASDFTPKLQLIRAWSNNLAKEQPANYPFRVQYERGHKSFTYLAVQHENKIGSSTFKAIQGALEERSYEVVVMEGFPRSEGFNSAQMIEWAKSDGSDGFFQGGETSFLIQQAQTRRIPFVGGEIDDVDLKSEAIKAGYTELDLLYFYFARQVPQLIRDGTLKTTSIEESYEKFMKKEMQELKVKSQKIPSYASFLDWYMRKNATQFSVQSMTSEVVAPLCEGTLFTQKLSGLIGVNRDRFIVKTIAEVLNRYNKVLVVYGGSHWVTQSGVFKDWFGSPKGVLGL